MTDNWYDYIVVGDYIEACMSIGPVKVIDIVYGPAPNRKFGLYWVVRKLNRFYPLSWWLWIEEHWPTVDVLYDFITEDGRIHDAYNCCSPIGEWLERKAKER